MELRYGMGALFLGVSYIAMIYYLYTGQLRGYAAASHLVMIYGLAFIGLVTAWSEHRNMPWVRLQKALATIDLSHGDGAPNIEGLAERGSQPLTPESPIIRPYAHDANPMGRSADLPGDATDL